MGGFTEGVDQYGRPIVHPRPQHTPEYLNTVYACGERRDHKVRIHRSNWPPKPRPDIEGPGFVEGVCERCKAHVQIYNPPDRSVTVVLYGSAAEAQGQVVDEAGEVVEEGGQPQATGTIVEEPEPSAEAVALGKRGVRR